MEISDDCVRAKCTEGGMTRDSDQSNGQSPVLGGQFSLTAGNAN